MGHNQALRVGQFSMQILGQFWMQINSNLAKSDKTLLEFCELAGLDFTQIVKALRELGKRV